MATLTDAELTPRQRAMLEVWERHLRAEFADHSADAAIATMSATPHLNHVPVMTGGVGRDAIRQFYATRFIPQMPPDTTIELISRTIGHDQIVDEMIFKCTHTVAMDWYLPGVAPTGRRIEVPTVAIVRFRDGAIESEHIYWDQASVLVQIGLLDAGKLPVAGVETALKLRDPERPSNALIARADRARA
ncbi:MAG: ester cyclase [Geminicoccaceae bacterium]